MSSIPEFGVLPYKFFSYIKYQKVNTSFGNDECFGGFVKVFSVFRVCC